jgi:hypothetical protein
LLFRKNTTRHLAQRLIAIPALMVGLCALAAIAQGQQTGQSGSTPPVGSSPVPGSSTQDQGPVSPVATSTQAVTGAFNPQVEAAGEVRSSVVFGVHADEYVDSNILGTATSSWLATTDIGGHLDLTRERETSDLALTVSGGGLIYPGNSQYNSGYGSAGITDTIKFRRGSLVLTDLFTFLPDSPLGFGAGGPNGIPGTPLSSYGLLNPSATPDQTILNSQANRLSNELLAQGQWSSSVRTTWTFTAGYGILHYTNSAFVQPSDFNFVIGYNRALTPNDVLGLSDSATLYRFSPSIYSTNDNTITVTYGRNLSRKLALKVGAGPEIDTFTSQVGATPGTRLSYSVNLGLNYVYKRAQLQVSGYRYVSGGSGILFGAETTGAQISISQPIGRAWALTGSVGYNLNQALSQTATAGSSYGSLIVSGAVSRRIGRTASVFLRYDVQHQSAAGATCNSTVCLATFNRQEGFVGFTWDSRQPRMY